jgi:hypothetical protein
LSLNSVKHVRTVVPHGLGENNRIGEGSPLADGLDASLQRLGQPMTQRTSPLGEQALPAPGVPRLVKESRRVEVGKKIGGGLLVQFAGANLLRAHRNPHRGSMVPHRTGKRRRCEIPVDAPSQVGTDMSAHAVDAVTLNAR